MTQQAYGDNTKIIDGAGEAFEFDKNASTVMTHASETSTTTVIQTATDPRLKFRRGDIIKVTTSGTAFRRIRDMSATTITLETPLGSAPAVDTAIVREWRVLGQTQGGIVLQSQYSVQERMSDQFLDTFNVKGDKRETTVNLPLIEYDPLNVALALGLADSQIDIVDSTTTRLSVGATSSDLNTTKILLIGKNLGDEWVTAIVHRCINKGQSQIRFAKEANSVLGLEMQVLLDTTQPVGKELYVLETSPAPNFGLHLDIAA